MHIFEKVDFILSVNCNNEHKLKVNLQFTLAKVTKPKFNGKL